MPVSDYYTSAGSNGPAEGCSPSILNDTDRDIKADIRAALNDFGWINYGSGSGPPAYTYVSSTSFSVPGDQTVAYWPQRRMRAVGSLTGTIYGHIVSRSFGSGVTTVVALWDSGSLSNETLTISLGIINNGNPVPTANTSKITQGTDGGVFLTPQKMADLTLRANPGYLRYPGDIRLQFGSDTTDGSGLRTVTYPISFTTLACPVPVAFSSSFADLRIVSSGLGSFGVQSTDASNNAKASVDFFWIAMGF